MKKTGGLRRRWIMNTIGVVVLLGLLCAAAVIIAFSAYYYASVESDLYHQASSTVSFLGDNDFRSAQEYQQACINYTGSYSNKNTVELQFLDGDGALVSTSYGVWVDETPETPEIHWALQSGAIETFRGRESATGQRIIAVSCPVVYGSGEVVGVLRFVTATRRIDSQIGVVAAWALAAVGVVALIVLMNSNYYIKSIVIPVAQITEKANRITAGTYGIQITTEYDDEIGELADAINEMSLQINQNEMMQREFISSLSHELRTPLTAINGWSETLLAGDTLDEDTRRGMNIISREAKRLTEMVVDLLDFTRMQDGRMTLNIETADVRGEFEDTVYMYSSRLSQENIHLHYHDNEDEIPEIPCDLKRLRQVFLNILDNAAKHGGEGGRIDASIHLEEPMVVVRIRDYGPGIPEDELALVKKKFYKGSSKARGTGIGLAVCEDIVLLHNGELTLENAEGGGTLVTVRLPISQ